MKEGRKEGRKEGEREIEKNDNQTLTKKYSSIIYFFHNTRMRVLFQSRKRSRTIEAGVVG